MIHPLHTPRLKQVLVYRIIEVLLGVGIVESAKFSSGELAAMVAETVSWWKH